MAKWKELPPSPEAIVRAALERAADVAKGRLMTLSDGLGLRTANDVAQTICALGFASAEVAAIIKKAGEDRG